MDRRKFLSSLIGGVTATAAVRTFPFRVFSYPKEIQRGNWHGMKLDPYPGPLRTPEASFLIDNSIEPMVAIYGSPIGGQAILLEYISRAEAKTRYGFEVFRGYMGRAPFVTAKISR